MPRAARDRAESALRLNRLGVGDRPTVAARRRMRRDREVPIVAQISSILARTALDMAMADYVPVE